MLTLRNFLISVAAIGLLCVIFIPDWFEDPVELAIGEWQGVPNRMRAEVNDTRVRWEMSGNAGRLSYTWVQTETEPYRVQFRRGEEVFEADIIFDGPDEVVVMPHIFDQLPLIAREHIARSNKAANRPENEIRYVFRRVKN